MMPPGMGLVNWEKTVRFAPPCHNVPLTIQNKIALTCTHHRDATLLSRSAPQYPAPLSRPAMFFPALTLFLMPSGCL